MSDEARQTFTVNLILHCKIDIDLIFHLTTWMNLMVKRKSNPDFNNRPKCVSVLTNKYVKCKAILEAT